jgi:hypothetical protein
MTPGGDNRKVQSAVVGGPDSDVPIILSPDSDEAREFQQEHEGQTFWCGRLLKGCGAQLTPKIYTDRACHFAHRPDSARSCSRKRSDVDSADHLYLRQAFTDLLSRTGLARRADTHFSEDTGDGAPFGAVVTIRLDNGAVLYAHMARSLPVQFHRDGHEGDLLLGPGVPISDALLNEIGYAHRVRFTSKGTARQIEFGTQVPGRSTQWFSPDECTLTDEGLLKTPAIETVSPGRFARPTAGHVDDDTRPALVPGAPGPAVALQLAFRERVGTLSRRLRTAVYTDDANLVRQVRAEAEVLLAEADTGAHGAASRDLSDVIAKAASWFEARDRHFTVLVDLLGDAVAHRRAGETESLCRQLQKLPSTRTPPTPEQREILSAANTFLREVREEEKRKKQEAAERAQAQLREREQLRGCGSGPGRPKKPREPGRPRYARSSSKSGTCG